MRKKTHKEFTSEVYNIAGNEYEILGEYLNAITKVEMKHVKCGNKYEVRPNDFLNGNRCPFCAGKMMNHSEFIKRVYDLVGNDYEVIGTYKSSAKKILMKHITCNNTYEVTPSNFYNGKRCPFCSGCIKKSHEDFEKEVYSLVGNEYEILSKYTNNKTKINILHNECGHIYEITPSSFLSGVRCAKCAGNLKKTTQMFKTEVFNLVENDYVVISEYANDATKIKLKHNICKNEYEVKPNSFLNGSRCPFCNDSHGEKEIKGFLDSFEIKYIPQYKFQDCRNKLPLPFDFALFNSDGLLNCLIEYDGEQHFKPIEHFGGEEYFNYIKLNDSIKDNYCKNNNIILMRIPYWEFNMIEEILKSALNIK